MRRQLPAVAGHAARRDFRIVASCPGIIVTRVLSPGTILGPYEVLSSLGAGGMGEVYRARDTRLGREVAIKVLPAHLVRSTAARDRFQREAKAVAALKPPNICVISRRRRPRSSCLWPGGVRRCSTASATKH